MQMHNCPNWSKSTLSALSLPAICVSLVWVQSNRNFNINYTHTHTQVKIVLNFIQMTSWCIPLCGPSPLLLESSATIGHHEKAATISLRTLSIWRIHRALMCSTRWSLTHGAAASEKEREKESDQLMIPGPVDLLLSQDVGWLFCSNRFDFLW